MQIAGKLSFEGTTFYLVPLRRILYSISFDKNIPKATFCMYPAAYKYVRI